MEPSVNAIILAAGNGKRVEGVATPKQLLKINGRYIIEYCLDTYQHCKTINSISLVVHENFRLIFEKLVEEGRYDKVRKVISGGKKRQDSIFNGLSSLSECDLVVIQNGVSIFTPEGLIAKCIRKAFKFKAVSAFVNEKYSSFMFEQGRVKEVLDRRVLGSVRDPQVFDFRLILDVHKRAHRENKYFTNDVLMLKNFGLDVYLVDSPPYNFKITFDIDIKLANSILSHKISNKELVEVYSDA